MNIYNTLNPMQKTAVEHTDGPLLILAGAGSGKTRVLTHKIAYLIDECNVNPFNILALTFTNKAAAEMRERVDDIVGYGSENIWVSTFHSTCVRILRRDINKLGYDRNFTIYDSEDQKTLMKDVCKKLNIDTQLYKEKTFLNAISSAKDELISADDYALSHQGDFAKQRIANVYREYQAQLKLCNALDFDDIIVKTVDLFINHPSILEYYQNRFTYIMVDEYQDTNTAQFRLISILANKNQNLCVVGDDDQSIYKFRGANIFNILNFEKTYPNAKVIKLEQNYRSTKNILNAANEVIKNNSGRKAKSLWTDNTDGDLIYHAEYETEYEEATGIVGDIDQMISEGADYSNFAILYRTNAQSRVFEEKFILKNIPYKIVGGVNFYQRKEVKDLLCYLKVINNGQDTIALRRIINYPRRGIGITTIEKVQDFANLNNISFYDAILIADQIPNFSKSALKVTKFANFIKMYKTKLANKTLTLQELINDIIETTGYVKELELEDSDEANARIENINELINKIVTYETTAKEEMREVSLSEFLEEVSLVADIDNLESSYNTVLLMTIHSAKGLEFPYVYLCGMEEGIFPSYMSIKSEDDSDMEEERRLCYVAITRARERLFISNARRRMMRGETQMNRISNFVQEIPRSLIKSRSEITPAPDRFPDFIKKAKGVFNNKPNYNMPSKQFTSNNTTTLQYGVGDTVKHVKFGVGIVMDITAGGKDFEVTVSFNNVGVKKMFASFANLIKLN